MDSKNKRYFTRMSKYTPRNIASYSKDNAAYLAYFKSMINKTSQDVLLEHVSPNNAKKDISSWLESIKELKEDMD
jgi:hypothetical protein